MVKEKEKAVESPLEQEQWKVEAKSDKYKRTYTTLAGVKRDYGQWCKAIEKDGQGEVEMYYRPNAKTQWLCIEEFSMGLDDDEDDEDDEDDDQDDE
jgi:hypothetical protein